MHYSVIISLIALAGAAIFGLMALFNPRWVAGFLHLTEDPDPLKPGGFSEFRATFGGLFLFLHMMAFVLILATQSGRPILTIMIVTPIAAAWIGAGFGRMLSYILDKEKNRSSAHVLKFMALEYVSGLAIMAPMLQFM